MRTVLSIDTSGSDASVAACVSEGGECQRLLDTVTSGTLAEISSHEELSHDERLMEMCRAALDRVGASFSSVSDVVVGLGPGSFTGLRIGLSFAIGLACGRNIPVRGYSTLLAHLWEGFHLADLQTTNLIALVDAKRDEVFALRGTRAQYSIESEELGTVLNDPGTVITIEPLAQIAVSAGERSDLAILSDQKLHTSFAGIPAYQPKRKAASLLDLDFVFGHLVRSAYPGRGESLEPVYVRGVSALTIEDRKVLRKA